MISLLAVLLLSFLLGSIPTSLWTGKVLKGIDIRQYGSGNAGATNTFRTLGWKAGVFVLTVDFLKGFVSTKYISGLAFLIASGPVSPPVWEADAFVKIACGTVAVIGHMFPVLAGFKGGKGGASAAGMLYGIEPVSISISVAIFFIVMFTTRYVSLGTVVSTGFYPINLLILRYGFGWDIDGSMMIIGTFAALFIIYKHKANMQRLANGTENRIASFRPGKGSIGSDAGSS